MNQYEFTTDGINSFYDAVYDESTKKIHEVMEEINSSQNPITDEQDAHFETIYNSIAITITIGSHTIVIPNNADNIELLFGMIQECKEQTT